MAGKNTAVFGIFPTRADADRGVDALIDAGFKRDDVSVLAPDQQSTREFLTEKHTKAPEGTTAGVLTGGALGGILGLLAAPAVFLVPGIGPFLVAGPLLAGFAGFGAGAAAGGLIGALVGLGIPEYEAKRYEGRVKEGGVLLSVHCDNSDWVHRAKEVLERSGAEDIASTGEKTADTQASNQPVGVADSPRGFAPTTGEAFTDVGRRLK